METPTDWKARIIYWGLSILFVLKFGKFIALEIWEVVAPLFAQSP